MYLHPLGGVVADLRGYEAETSRARVPRWRKSHEIPQNTRRHLPNPKFDHTAQLSDQWITREMKESQIVFYVLSLLKPAPSVRKTTQVSHRMFMKWSGQFPLFERAVPCLIGPSITKFASHHKAFLLPPPHNFLVHPLHFPKWSFHFIVVVSYNNKGCWSHFILWWGCS